ncbi:MAG: UvrD-helicase domain-containing protein [Lachnospiraceae bacterium]|nr:UvrD-helicase domain-containing protein [Lachnospiraceae bacterium]
MYIGDLHIHSRYSRATSRDCTPEYLDLWAGKKGIDIIGTGDFTHPAWRAELAEKLEPAEEGLYVLKKEYRLEGAPSRQPRFVVTGEISSIYKKGDRVRKVHSLLLLPNLEAADALARRLELIGNIHSDGRPILGLPCRDLLEIMLETTPGGIYVPAHIWTPHFSMFGAFSGFDTVEECFEDLTPHIRALETGLSSDPPMNWRVSALDRFHLISNSDAHSPAKLGREANLFDIELSYDGLADAISNGKGLAGTIEFFPEEGKYHFDGHRKCGLCISPSETAQYGNKCPVCGKKITIGVLNRVEQLADREEGYLLPTGRPFESLVPLLEVIGASTGISSAGKKATEQYEHLIKALGSEFSILREIPVEDIRKTAGPLIAEGIQRLRSGQVERTPGFDGEYGKIGLLTPEDISGLEGQISLFTTAELQALSKNPKEKITGREGHGNAGQSGNAGRNESGGPDNISGQNSNNSQNSNSGKNGCEEPGCGSGQKPAAPTENLHSSDDALQPAHVLTLNERQQKAAAQTGRRIAVIAGPGAGKTKTLIARLHYLLDVREIPPGEITAVTFTNKAAEEMRARMDGSTLSGKTDKKRIKSSEKPAVQIGTFHAICSRFLQNAGLSFMIADTGLQTELAEKALLEFERKDSPSGLLRELSKIKNGLVQADEKNRRIYEYYQRLLLESGAMDYDDLLLETLKILKELSENAPERKCFSHLLIDEFQDINPLQYQLMTEWSRGGQELFVIGDPDQSIYGFRGCNPNIFQRLAVDSPDLITTRLKENYRSAPDILQAALGVISHNEGEPRSMTARKAGRRPVRIAAVEDERREAIFVAKEINRQIGGIDMLDTEQSETGIERPIRGFSDIAVLYRTHRQAALLEKCLRLEGIPYQVAGREDFLNEREVRTTLYFFYQTLYPGEKTAESLCQKLLSHWLKESPEEQLAYLTEKYRKKIRKTRPLKLLEEWDGEINFENKEAIKKLTDMSVLHSTMEDFLRTLTFGEDGDVRRNGGRKFTSDAVTLMTLHGSKGLEFPVVFLYGMDKGRFPLEFGGVNTADSIEEERRLCYVGMTRAEEELILVCGQEPSCFLQEIPPENVRWERPEKMEDKDAEKAVQMSLFDFI